MHPISLAIIISLLLPLLTKAQAPRWRPASWPPPVQQDYYWGDVLNITKCYCEGGNGHRNPGSYYQFDYRNFHNKQEYTLGWACDSDKTADGVAQVGRNRVGFPVPECWNEHDSWRKEKRAACVRSYNADVFCFELGNKNDPYHHYYFNGEKKRLPDSGITEFPPVQCEDLCREKVPGLTLATDVKGKWEKYVPGPDNRLTTVRSSFQSYTDLEDMTAN